MIWSLLFMILVAIHLKKMFKDKKRAHYEATLIARDKQRKHRDKIRQLEAIERAKLKRKQPRNVTHRK